MLTDSAHQWMKPLDKRWWEIPHWEGRLGATRICNLSSLDTSATMGHWAPLGVKLPVAWLDSWNSFWVCRLCRWHSHEGVKWYDKWDLLIFLKNIYLSLPDCQEFQAIRIHFLIFHSSSSRANHRLVTYWSCYSLSPFSWDSKNLLFTISWAFPHSNCRDHLPNSVHLTCHTQSFMKINAYLQIIPFSWFVD